ncbi:PKD domain-containing protein [Paenibacillus sp. FSL W7-1287]|uniref:PKD domain-containing protein n=1 Tax=Paenibacillus sp. FSL W7-1287 TaxID=2954538 RepID=UPI0030FD0403
MKRLYLSFLILGLLIGLIPNQQAQAKVSIEVEEYYNVEPEEGLSESRKEYKIPYPKDAASVLYQSGTYSYDKGTDRIVKFSPNRAEGFIEVTIIGEKVTGTIDVEGYRDSEKLKLSSTPGNVFCRYSDGYDWQANTYNLSDGREYYKRYTSNRALPDKPTPPTDIPYGKVHDITTFVDPTFNIAGTTWLNGDTVIPSNKVIHNTVHLPKDNDHIKPTLGNPAFVANQKYDPYKPTIGTQYSPTEKTFGLLRDINSNNPAFLTGHAACKMYPVTIEYILVAKAEVETYKYDGTITFKYIKSEDPMLVGELIADPNSIKFADKDIKVNVTLNAEVINMKDPGALRDYRIYLRTENNSQSAPLIKITANGKTKVTGTYEFTIPKTALAGKEDLTQIFNGRAKVDFKSGMYKGELDTGLLTANTYVYKKADPPPPVIKPELKSPVAIINGDQEVKKGDYAVFHGLESYDPDGYIVEYRWTMPNAKDAPPSEWNPAGETATAWYDQLGPQRLQLHVKDNDDLQHSTIHSLVVVEPTVEAAITQTGTLKENRKVTFTESSNTPLKYPTIDTKTTWKIESINENLNNQIKYEGALKGKKSIDVLFKKAGDYRVTVSVENTAGYTSTATQVYKIKPDEEPYANFEFQKKIYRDPEKGNIATFTLKDRSYSFDGDTIAKRNWYVVFDANNDGVFNETKQLFATGNETEVSYETTHVGEYRFMLEVQEEFGQPTIEAFVTASDRKKSNTWQ